MVPARRVQRRCAADSGEKIAWLRIRSVCGGEVGAGGEVSGGDGGAFDVHIGCFIWVGRACACDRVRGDRGMRTSCTHNFAFKAPNVVVLSPSCSRADASTRARACLRLCVCACVCGHDKLKWILEHVLFTMSTHLCVS